VQNTFYIRLANSTSLATQNSSAGAKYFDIKLANSKGLATQNSTAGAKYF
jgi:hypothetical protein